MTDIIERLRYFQFEDNPGLRKSNLSSAGALMSEAADEIERLRERLECFAEKELP